MFQRQFTDHIKEYQLFSQMRVDSSGLSLQHDVFTDLTWVCVQELCK